jgi:hypothetical protein
MNALGVESMMVFKTLNRFLDLKKTFVFLRDIAERWLLCMYVNGAILILLEMSLEVI